MLMGKMQVFILDLSGVNSCIALVMPLNLRCPAKQRIDHRFS